MDALAWLERWYLDLCDGEWEHSGGVTLESLDNPGWRLTLDLKGTRWEDLEAEQDWGKEPVGPNWIAYQARGGVLIGACGPGKLGDLIRQLAKLLK